MNKSWQYIKPIIPPALFVGFIWVVKLLEWTLQISLSDYGVFPRTIDGLRGILFSPLLHGDFNHLLSNSAPLLILGYVLFSVYPKVSYQSIIWVWLLGGLWLWIGGRSNFHIGASGVVYGLASFLFFMGAFRRDFRAVATALFVVAWYGGLVWGLFPLEQGISWEGHLYGGIAGLFTAIGFYERDRVPSKVLEEDPIEAEILPYWLYEVEGDLKSEYQTPEVIYEYKSADNT